MTEQRYGALSTLKAIGIGLLPLVVLVVLGFYNPSDFGTKAARASLGASTIEEADGGKVDRRGYLAAALEDFDRFSAFVDAEATNTAAYEAARWQAMKRETIEAAELLAPHLTIDYSWDDELGKALTELKAGPLFSAMAGVVFPVPETRELRLKLTNMDEEKLGKLKEEYVRFRVFPFASGTWVRWCLLTREERKAAAMGPLWDLAIWLATSLGLGGLFYFFMVRH